MNTSTAQGLEQNWGYFKAMNARKLAKTAILNALHSYDINSTPEVNRDIEFADGSFRITELKTSAEPFDTVWITARGTYADTSVQIYCTLLRETELFPNVAAAIGIRARPVSFSMNSSAEIDGRNYTADGSNTVGWGDIPGVAVMTEEDAEEVYEGGEKKKKGQLIEGSEPVVVDTAAQELTEYFEEYVSKADYNFTQSVIGGKQTFGSETNPVIVVCDSRYDTRHDVKFTGNVNGYGILAVRGDLEVTSSFDWYGLVVVLGESNSVKFTASGKATIVGGLLIAHEGKEEASISLKGSHSQIKYSSAALANARNVGKLRSYTVVDWYE